MAYQLKELGLGGILDQTLNLLRNRFGLFFGIVLILVVPLVIVMQYTDPRFGATTPGERVQEQSPEATILWAALAFVTSFIAGPIANAAVVYAAAGEYTGNPQTMGQAISRAFRVFLPLIWTSILYGAAMMGGFILCIIPGILCALWFALSTEVVVLERISGFAALRRSKALMTGSMGKLFALIMLIGVINIFVNVGAAFIPQRHVSAVATGLAQGLTTILGALAVVVFYFSVRCKHENFDLVLLAEAVGTEPPDDAFASPDFEA